MNNSYITIIKEKRTALSRKRVPLNQNECTADFRIGVPFEQNLQAIDAKEIREPQFLKENIIRDGGFPDGDYKRGFYVIPDAYADDRTDYLDIINRQLESMGNRNIRCIKLRDLKREIRERGKQK